MPGGLKCAECSTVTLYPASLIEGRIQYVHKPDCSQRGLAWPKMYIISSQAINPSQETE
jgi:hypothetical protein